jgi:hypothetical protein
VEDGGVLLYDQTLLEGDDALDFLLEQAAAPATDYVHKSMTLSGLAEHTRRLRAKVRELEELRDLEVPGS